MFFFPKISLQTACSIDTDALTSWFSPHDSCLPSYMAQYEPVSCIPALWSIKSLAQRESGQIIKRLVHFSFTCRWHMSIHNGAHARAAVSGLVTIVLERSRQYSRMVSPESVREIKR